MRQYVTLFKKHNKRGIIKMSIQQFNLIRVLSNELGIYTQGELEAFKKHVKVRSNEGLVRHLCLYVANGWTVEFE